VGARVLGITLTKRPRGKDGDIPMAGVPYHAANTYINKLIKSGYKIAICEQITEPNSKGIVDRAVVRIITPGTVLDDVSLPQKKHNFVMSISVSKKKIGLAVADVSTGHFSVTEIDRSAEDKLNVKREISTFSPQECIVSSSTYNDPELLCLLAVDENCFVAPYHDWSSANSKNILKDHFGLSSLQTIGLETAEFALEAAANLIKYLEHTQQQEIKHLSTPRYYSTADCLLLDSSTITNLELFTTLRSSRTEGSLLGQIDQTSTAAGGRLLHSWLAQPLHSVQEIKMRLDAVEELFSQQVLRTQIISELKNVYDIERQLAKLSLQLATSAAVINISDSLKLFLLLHKQVSGLYSSYWQDLKKISTDDVMEIINLVQEHLEESSTENHSTVYVIKSGIHSELDELRAVRSGADEWLKKFEEQERIRTGITSLKCKFNSVFGFYIEISNANLNSVPDNYQRKQTLVNAERFITPELKHHEEIFLSAQERISELELEIFNSLIKKILKHSELIKTVAFQLAQIDVLCTFAQYAHSNNYCKPLITEGSEIEIIEGRHPVVEALVKEKFVPNDVYLNSTSDQLLLITGPNMAGKSVAMRQTAIIVLLAHIGSFVPAKSATIPLTDRIFVRSGASDNISDGLSTFMVEMVEAAYILHHATSNSLVIMDEIGRGTSTYDGISIAWAIAEYFLNSAISPKVLFATHYHELQSLADEFPDKVKNYKVAVERHKGKPLFLYTLQPGKSSHSFGISVAELAGVPQTVIERAERMLKTLEQKSHSASPDVEDQRSTNSQKQTSIVKQLASVNVNELTPLEAFQLVLKLQNEMKHVKNS
jgi:DNA mismatch repair protein MutS